MFSPIPSERLGLILGASATADNNVLNANMEQMPLPSEPAFERHLSVQDVSQMWSLSEDKVRAIFEHEPGVIVIGNEETRYRRGYRTLRIPESIVRNVHKKLRVN